MATMAQILITGFKWREKENPEKMEKGGEGRVRNGNRRGKEGTLLAFKCHSGY